MFVVIEWNQASHRPSLATPWVYDTYEEADEVATFRRKATAEIGRREEYTVHELGEHLDLAAGSVKEGQA